MHSTGTNANHKQAISTSFSPGTSFDDDATKFFWLKTQKQSKNIKKTSGTHLAVNILWKVLKSPATLTVVNATRPASETALGVRLVISQLL